jgi:phosphoenolpyruvate carboxylase
MGSSEKLDVAAHPLDGMSILQAMYREWPFFQTTLSNMDMVSVLKGIERMAS